MVYFMTWSVAETILWLPFHAL